MTDRSLVCYLAMKNPKDIFSSLLAAIYFYLGENKTNKKIEQKQRN
jgi:hypothetical protein